MKHLAILTVLATPALGHQVPYNNQSFLKIAGGNAKDAQRIEYLCNSKGMTNSECADKFSGAGNFGKEAALACYEKFANTELTFKINGTDTEIPGSRMHKLEGATWHKDYEKSPETGRLHRHQRSESDRNRAVNEYEAVLITQAILKVTAFNGSAAKSSEGGVNGGIDFGISAPVTLTINLGGSSSDGKNVNMALLSPGERERIEKEKQKARDDWSLTNVDPSVVCYHDEPKCSDGSKNESYQEKKEENKDDKKGAENPPKSEDDPHHDVPDIISTTGGDSWAGNEAISNDPTMIATPAMDDPSAVSPIEACIQKETKRLTDNIGRLNIDPNSVEAKETEEDLAKSLMLLGYCDEKTLGKSVCSSKKFMENSVVAITLLEERKEAAQQALKSYKFTGICNPNALGRDFCKAEKFKWDTTPAGFKEVLIENRIILRPIKSGDIPKLHD